MKNKTDKTGQSGFTLVEIMIVLLIIVIMAAIAYASLVRTQAQQLFNNQFDSILSLIKNARSLAITGKGQLDYTDYDHDGKTATTSPVDYVTPANYGVHFDTTAGAENVVLFADINPPTSGSPSGQKGRYDSGGIYATGDDLKLGNIVNLGNDFCIKLEVPTATPTPYSSGSIFFSPNYADISFENFNLSSSPFLLIRLHDKTQVNRCKQIRIHKLAGIPEVEQCSGAGATETCS